MNLDQGGQISVWDFGGQMEYTVTHQFFLSNEVCIFNFILNLFVN